MVSKSKHILVTGGAGFVGTHLCRKLVEQGYKVVVLDLRQPQTVVSGVEYIQGDVRNEALTQKLVAAASAVYHLAATVSVPLCQKDPIESYSNNFNATLVVLEAIRKNAEQTQTAPVPMVFASTAALYGTKGDDGRALVEDDVASEFLSFYAAQKHASEKVIELYRRFYNVPAFIFRFFNIYGPGQDPTSPYSGVITIFTKFAKEGKPMPLNDGGYQTRDFISVYDIASACASVLNVPLTQWDPKPINLGTNKKTTIRELAEIIRDSVGSKSEITKAPAREGDVTHSLANIDRARKFLNFNPNTDLNKLLREI